MSQSCLKVLVKDTFSELYTGRLLGSFCTHLHIHSKKTGQSEARIHLDLDNNAIQSDHGAGKDARQHGISLGWNS